MSATPLLVFGDTFPATVTIGRVVLGDKVVHEGTALPLHIKRMSRPEIDVFETKWAELIEPRGDLKELTPAEIKEREKAQLTFFEESIRAYVTVDEGLLVDRGKAVTDGAGLIGMFYSRKDVLSDFLVAIFTENRLGGALRKNSKSPRDSGTGSGPSIQARGGEKPDSTVTSAAPSTSAQDGDVTGASAPAAAASPASSGDTSGAMANL
jgi:hypothetical protein